ncbi:MAG: hypothetical protein K1000chlam3_00115 [Chlamydiae bacterium]|nr:hypothetical protein [Chlamydiota bacterium]
MVIKPVGSTSNQAPLELFSKSVVQQRNEFGKKNEDTIASSDQKKESWGACATRWLCFVPNLMWLCVKKVLCVVTCGLYCSDKPSREEIKKGVEKVLEVWKKVDATNEEKSAAWKDFCNQIPGAKEEILNAFMDVHASAAKGSKATEKEKEEWIKENGKDLREKAEKSISDMDINWLETYLARLVVEASENASS